MEIDLLYFDGCPSWQNGLENLKAALMAEKIDVDIHMVRVETNEEAQKEKFLGSPSFRVNGQDLWPEERSEEQREFFLDCRVYATDKGLRGVPSVEMLRERIRAAAK